MSWSGCISSVVDVQMFCSGLLKTVYVCCSNRGLWFPLYVFVGELSDSDSSISTVEQVLVSKVSSDISLHHIATSIDWYILYS